MKTETITSVTNSRIKDLVRLRDRRNRDRSRLFLVEGYREIQRGLDAGVEIETLFVCPGLFLGSNEEALIAKAESTGSEVLETAIAPFRKASYRDRPEGLLAVCRQFDTSLERMHLSDDSLVLVAEAIEKPGNLGTMLRTADAVGASAIVCDPTTDPFNPNVVRASTGTLFTVPLAVADAQAVIGHLAAHGIRSIATTPDTSTLLYDIDLSGPVAIVVGSEQYGLTDRWLQAADERARLPMAGTADSLNAAMAAAVSLFEAVRQRSC